MITVINLQVLSPTIGLGIQAPDSPQVLLYGCMYPKRAWNSYQATAEVCFGRGCVLLEAFMVKMES